MGLIILKRYSRRQKEKVGREVSSGQLVRRGGNRSQRGVQRKMTRQHPLFKMIRNFQTMTAEPETKPRSFWGQGLCNCPDHTCQQLALSQVGGKGSRWQRCKAGVPRTILGSILWCRDQLIISSTGAQRSQSSVGRCVEGPLRCAWQLESPVC